MSNAYIMAIDQGTTGTTVVIIDQALQVHARCNQEFPQIYPQPGWVEHNPEAIWRSTQDTIRRAVQEAGLQPHQIAAVGITNQRETTVLWERASGTAIHNALVWQDRRTASTMARLREEGHEHGVTRQTGLLLDPYFSASKIAWILDHVAGARERAERGELAFGTIDTFLLWRLSAGKVHKTDVSNASRTLLMDLEEQAWSPELLKLFRVPEALLPEICSNSELYGVTSGVEGLADGTPICGMAGDQQAALFGQACFDAGESKCTLGTGAFLLMNTGDQLVRSTSGMLTTAAWRLNGNMTYALEGSAFVAGSLVQWLRDGLGFINSSAEIETLAASVQSSDGVVFVPALTGLGAPYWNPEARGVLHGLTRGTTRAHIARAALEGIAFQNFDILDAMHRDLGRDLTTLKVDGGAAANNLLLQLHADLLQVPIVRPSFLDTTAFGCALLAGLAVDVFSDLDDIRAAWREDRTFQPRMDEPTRQTYIARWRRGIDRV